MEVKIISSTARRFSRIQSIKTCSGLHSAYLSPGIKQLGREANY